MSDSGMETISLLPSKAEKDHTLQQKATASILYARGRSLEATLLESPLGCTRTHLVGTPIKRIDAACLHFVVVMVAVSP